MATLLKIQVAKVGNRAAPQFWLITPQMIDGPARPKIANDESSAALLRIALPGGIESVELATTFKAFKASNYGAGGGSVFEVNVTKANRRTVSDKIAIDPTDLSGPIKPLIITDPTSAAIVKVRSSQGIFTYQCTETLNALFDTVALIDGANSEGSMSKVANRVTPRITPLVLAPVSTGTPAIDAAINDALDTIVTAYNAKLTALADEFGDLYAGMEEAGLMSSEVVG